MNKWMLESLARNEHQFRPLMLKLLGPQKFIQMYSKLRPSMIGMLGGTDIEVKAPRKEFQKWGLTFRNDVGNAAGLDKDGSLLEFNYKLGAGFALVGTCLHKPHTGNLYPMGGTEHNPWTPLPNSHSAINSLGLPGKGIEPVLERIKAFKAKYKNDDFPVGLSVMGHPKEEGEEKIAGVEYCLRQALPHVDFMEINESCPNVQHHDHSALALRIERFCQLRDQLAPHCPLWFKFASCPDKETFVQLSEKKAQAVVLTNTQTNYEGLSKGLHDSDRALLQHYTQQYKGGLSGKVIQTVSEEEVLKAKSYLQEMSSDLEVVHVGGLKTFDDMQRSRQLTPLREWYSGLMESMGSLPLDYIYPALF